MYERFKKLLDDSGCRASDVARSTGISQVVFSEWKKGKSSPKQDKKDRIANFFKVDKNIFSDYEQSYCLECGNQLSMIGDGDNYHDVEHDKWKRAVEKFGFCWSYPVLENAKSIARTDLLNGNLEFDEKISANIDIFKALFSRSLSANDYSLNHVKFNSYVAMLLNQEQFEKSIDKDVYTELIKMYGTSNGINEGETYYHVKTNNNTHTIAAHKEYNENWTDEELAQIDNYKQLLLAARNNKKD